jgi:hypothetical protein
MHEYIYEMLCQSSLSDTTFGGMHISGFPKSKDESYAHTVEM